MRNSQKYISHLVVINIVDTNSRVNFLNTHTTVCKELQIESNALTVSHCHLPAKHECCWVSQGSV